MTDPFEKELKQFSVTALFMVTAVSSFLFYFIIRVLDGMRTDFFIWTGFISLLIGIISFLVHKQKSPRTQDGR